MDEAGVVVWCGDDDGEVMVVVWVVVVMCRRRRRREVMVVVGGRKGEGGRGLKLKINDACRSLFACLASIT